MMLDNLAVKYQWCHGDRIRELNNYKGKQKRMSRLGDILFGGLLAAKDLDLLDHYILSGYNVMEWIEDLTQMIEDYREALK
ncbi:hypothetical protein [Paenibacillus sp. FSL W7-1332]|uniref:hypothetical protein n=1 Tax=Paenibacillus sp. FSL W7-1332 TaxID=2921702 RepID=UPI0030D1CDDF